MSTDNIRELEYLRRMCAKYGQHHINRLFGFGLKDIAKEMGMCRTLMSGYINGRFNFPIDRTASLAAAFVKMDIEKRTFNLEREAKDIQYEIDCHRYDGKR